MDGAQNSLQKSLLKMYVVIYYVSRIYSIYLHKMKLLYLFFDVIVSSNSRVYLKQHLQ